jgi:hypothetical protein
MVETGTYGPVIKYKEKWKRTARQHNSGTEINLDE